MKRDMKKWVEETIASPTKKPMPILSFPCVSLLGIGVKELISSSELQAKGMISVAQNVDSSAAVSLMDLSVEAEAFGSEIKVSDNEVPTVIGAIVSDEDEANALNVPKVGDARTGLYIETIAKATKEITDRPVFAGVIGPFSLAGRLMDVNEAMIYCYDEPDMVEIVLNKVTDFIIEYIKAYKEAGANGVLIAEPLTGLLSPSLAREFSHPYLKKIVDAVQADDFAVIYHNCGNNVALMAKDIYEIGAMGYHFGDAVKMADMLPDAPKDALVMGNVSPSVQFLGGTPESMEADTIEIMNECCSAPNFVISSGCDIPPLAPWANINAFFAAANKFYNK